MPVPAAFFGPGAVIGMKKFAFHALTYLDLSTISSATFTLICVRYIYQSLPSWVKEDISFKSWMDHNNDTTNGNNYYANGGFKVQHVAEKISKLKDILKHTDHPDDFTFSFPAVLALIQLSAQLKMREETHARLVTNDNGTTLLCDTSVEEEKKGDDDDDDVATEPFATRSFMDNTTVDFTSRRDEAYSKAGDTVEESEWRSDEIKHALDLATWSYHEDSDALERKLLAGGYGMLSHQLSVRPGTVAHYVAVHPQNKTVVVSLRGTSSLEDLLTDCLGLSQPLVEDKSLVDDHIRVEVQASTPHVVMVDDSSDHDDTTAVEIVSGHERIFISSQGDHHHDKDHLGCTCHEGILTAARNVLDVIGKVLRDYVQQCDYKILFVGHSLGAGTAIVAAQLLRAKYPELRSPNSQRIQVIAFAPPPVLDHDSAIAASSYCTSIVNGADIIPRCSVSSVLSTLSVLAEVQSRMIDHGMNPVDPKSTMNFINKLSEGEHGTPIMTAAEFQETIRKSQIQVELRKPQHLFVPGRVYLTYKERRSEDWKCIKTTGIDPILQTLEVDGLQCLTDHLTVSYYEAVGSEYNF
eukprot:CAMPEP_0113480408 /NCGR_PEP_ID=MMETSP0014_2-20120614/21859_1 /TAXON_ID=2857 /ORGANISM="Nitzschia sp." /LENGTH=579 /DNA_ID=CAMNT_0000373835 /DNA_START=177 /DNA_END=1916 /DNA_ORIENTATION=- /assembly_acc=CAM_ASM_000159